MRPRRRSAIKNEWTPQRMSSAAKRKAETPFSEEEQQLTSLPKGSKEERVRYAKMTLNQGEST